MSQLQNSPYNNHSQILSDNSQTIMDFMKSIGSDTNKLYSLLNIYTNGKTKDEIITFIKQNTPQNTSSYSSVTQPMPTNSPMSVSTLTPQQKQQKKQQLIDIMKKYDESNMTRYTQPQKNEFINAKTEYTKLFGTEPYSYTTTPTSSSWWPFGGGKRRTTRRARKQHKKLKTKRSKTQKRYLHR